MTAKRLSRELGRVRELTSSRCHSEALVAAEALAIEAPLSRDVIYLIAVNQRYLGRVSEALQTLERLEQRYPRFSRLHQERGHCYMALRDAPRAIEAFVRGVHVNPALLTSWSMLERLYRLTGAVKEAVAAAERLSTLKRMPPEVIQAGSLFSDGELIRAEDVIRAYLLKDNNHIEARRLLVRVLIDRQKYLRAREEVEALRAIGLDDRDCDLLYATACVGLGEHEQAIALYRQLLAATPESPELHLLLAHSLRSLGRRTEAIQCYQAAVASRPSFGDAYWSLANLKTYSFSAVEIAGMRALEASADIQPVDRYHVCFALGKALEDREEYSESWAYYERGNALKRAEGRYDPEIMAATVRRQVATFTADLLTARANVGVSNAGPIFIVGLPRSGSTLIEQILASHPQVEATQELPAIQHMVHELQGRQPDDFRWLGERYLTDTLGFRKQSTPYFIDKMPNNFLHIGLIHLMLPNARIIDVRREPLACCFSNLKQLFGSGQEFTYSVEDIAHYYRMYLELMRHWDQVLRGRILRVHYENVVADLEGNVRRILDFCGLEFEPACIDFHETERSIATASSEQVRQPLFREGLSQWRHYEPWLGPLKDSLGDSMTRYRDGAGH